MMDHLSPYPEKIPYWAKRLGFFEWRIKSARSRNIELCFDRKANNVLAIKFSVRDGHWQLRFALWPFQCFWRTPIKAKRLDKFVEAWGFVLHTIDLHLNWGESCKVIYLPWHWGSCRSQQIWTQRGWVDWQPYSRTSLDHLPERNELPDDVVILKKPYRYVRRSGEIQERTATVKAVRMEWRWHWFKWLPWPRKVRTSIDVSFDDEVGERSGSWKGGCLGCGYTMIKGETIIECLRRMERERRFT